MTNPVITIQPTSIDYGYILGTYGSNGDQWRTTTDAATLNPLAVYSGVYTNDANNNSAVIWTGNTVGRIAWTLQTLSLPPLAQIVRVRQRSYIRTDIIGSANSGIDYTMYVFQGASGSAGDNFTADPGTGAMVTGSWMTMAPDGGAWTLAKVNALEFAALIDYNSINHKDLCIAECYVDIEYNTAPTVAFTSPTYADIITDNAKPQFTWTYADGESDAETSWEVLVFSGTVNDPAASSGSAITSSGVVTSAATSWTPSVLLPDGTLYAYIRATDAIGTTGPWNAVQFTINVNPPTVVITSPGSGATITATDSPTVTWSFSDPGGGVQDRYELAIFTTQVNDPEASIGAAVVSSGEVFNGASTVTLGSPLPNGSYWLYVRAGNNSAGGRYSAWVGVPFQMNVAPPTVSFTAPTANQTLTETNRPTFTWNFHSALGFAEERWQVLVFLQGENDPEAAIDSALLNSGEQFNSLNTWTPPTGLSNGTYFAYVRVADVGTNTYSTWASVIFKISSLPPAIPVLNFDASPINFPATANVPSVAINVLTAENALDADTADLEGSIGTWTAALNATVGRVTGASNAKSGSAYLSMTASAAGECRATTGLFPITGSRYVSVAASVLPHTTARKVWARIDWYAGSALLSSTSGPQYTEVSGDWIQIEATGSAPATATNAALSWVVESAASAEIHYLDTAYIRVTPNKTAYDALDDPNFIWPSNLFYVPSFQDDILPSDVKSAWQVVNTVTDDADPTFWHSGDSAIPSVTNPIATRILDLAGLPAFKGAYSVTRLLTRLYAGYAFRVTRASDAATLDVGFTASGDVDFSPLASFANGSVLYLTILYDQSGNGFNLSQTSTSHAFRVYSGSSLYTVGSNGRLCMYAEDAARGMFTGAFTSDTTSHLSAVVVGVMPSGGGGAASGKTENVIDDFTTENSVLWNGYGSGNPGVVSGQLNIVPDSSYESISTVDQYDLTGSYIELEIVQRPDEGNDSIEGQLSATIDSDNQLAMIVSGTNLTCRERVGGTNSDTTVAWDDTNMKFWRIRESSGTGYWETSPDATTWTTQRSKTLAIASPTAVNIEIVAGYWGTETTVGTFIVDSLNGISSAGIAPQMAGVYGSTNTDSSDSKGAVLVGRQGVSAATAILRNSATRASQALSFGQLSMLGATIDETTDTYVAAVDGTFTTGSTYNGGAFAATHFSTGYDGASYASVTGMSECELYLADATLTATQLNLMQANISGYFGSLPVPVSTGTGGGSGSGTGGGAVNTAFKLVASDDMSTNPLGDWIFYDYGTATSYVANSWMARNATYNSSGKYLDLKAWKNGTYREGAGGFWNLPAATGLSMAWEVDFSCDDSVDYGFVFLTWPTSDSNWPINGEIDVYEKYAGDHFNTGSGESNFHMDTVAGSGRHLMAPSSSSSLTGCLAPNIAAGNYQVDTTVLHTWRVEWISGVSIAVYVDGQLRAKTTDTSYVPHTLPHRLTLQQEFYNVSDSSVPSTFVAHTRIYGVRAYAYQP